MKLIKLLWLPLGLFNVRVYWKFISETVLQNIKTMFLGLGRLLSTKDRKYGRSNTENFFGKLTYFANKQFLEEPFRAILNTEPNPRRLYRLHISRYENTMPSLCTASCQKTPTTKTKWKIFFAIHQIRLEERGNVICLTTRCLRSRIIR